MTTFPYSVHSTARRLAFAGAAVLLLLLATLIVSPAARVRAGELLHQVGIITLVNDAGQPGPTTPLPTAKPPVATNYRSAADAAEATQLADFRVYAPAELPNGYFLDGGYDIAPQGAGTNVFSLYRNSDGHFLVVNQFQYGPGDHFEQSHGNNELVDEVTVRGLPGISITGRLMTDPGTSPSAQSAELLTTNWLMWDENGIMFTLYSDDLSIDELAAVAESLGK